MKRPAPKMVVALILSLSPLVVAFDEDGEAGSRAGDGMLTATTSE